MVSLGSAAQAAQLIINGPAGSGAFGSTVTTLPNGNIVVTDPTYDAPGPITNVGAVYLYRPDGTLISTLIGSTAYDGVGLGGVEVLVNGNYVVRSVTWRNGASAVTFGSRTHGVSGVVSAANSLVGSTADDRIGNGGVTALSNGNYVVSTTVWDNGSTINVGAVTFGSGVNGISGVVSPTNSLVGSTANDLVGSSGVVALSSGNYLVRSSIWDNGSAIDAGAVTFGSGTSGVSGVVSPTNSLVGSSANDEVGKVDPFGGAGVKLLSNGSYVICNSYWDNGAVFDAGAVTFGSGAIGVSGVVSQFNSLVGNKASDLVGNFCVTALSNGNYVVRSPYWNNGAIFRAGAVTFGSGINGISGVVSPANSLVGSKESDRVGWIDNFGVTALSNGNYVVRSPSWDNGAIPDVGAVTFGSGTIGISGFVSPANSLIGSKWGDLVGEFGVTALSNGNYVVESPHWDNGAALSAGAVTFGSGTSGIIGEVSPTNSLVGSTSSDKIGDAGVTALSNGNYVVRSSVWDNGAITDAGAATFGSGTSGIFGVVSPTNSLVGSTAGDGISFGVNALSNGNYVVRSPRWDNGAIVDAGAATFGSGTSGIIGEVSSANSLIGSTVNDQVGYENVTELSNGNYLVRSPYWNNGAILEAGAVTLGSGVSGISGAVSPANSLVGSTADDFVGYGVIALINGNYLVRTTGWDNGATVDSGAITFGSGMSGISGAISTTNSLVGTKTYDFSSTYLTALSNGNYIVNSLNWDNGAIINAGAITLGLSDGSVVGPITNIHSVLDTGFVESDKGFGYDSVRNQLAVGQPESNRLVLHRTGVPTTINIVGDTPNPSTGGQPVTFTATVSATPSSPTDGQVTFTASSGESCADTSPAATTTTTADYSCVITFTTHGSATVVAEYTGSIIHAYSGSDSVGHTTNMEPVMFSSGFEND